LKSHLETLVLKVSSWNSYLICIKQ
jgi:hypothetical protein